MVFVCFCGMTIAYPKTQHQQWFPGRGLQSENKTWIERYVDSDTHKYCVSLCVYHVCVYHVSSDLHKEQHNMQAESTQIHPQLELFLKGGTPWSNPHDIQNVRLFSPWTAAEGWTSSCHGNISPGTPLGAQLLQLYVLVCDPLKRVVIQIQRSHHWELDHIWELSLNEMQPLWGICQALPSIAKLCLWRFAQPGTGLIVSEGSGPESLGRGAKFWVPHPICRHTP